MVSFAPLGPILSLLFLALPLIELPLFLGRYRTSKVERRLPEEQTRARSGLDALMQAVAKAIGRHRDRPDAAIAWYR